MSYDLIKQAARLYALADRATYGEDCTHYLELMDSVTAQYARSVGVSRSKADDTLYKYMAEVAA